MPMQPQQLATMRALLDEQRVLALALVVEGEPVIGLLPFAPAAGYRALVVHASRLARHTRGLQHGASFDALIHEPVAPGGDALQVRRLTLRGEVLPLAQDTPGADTFSSAYLLRFPEAAPITQLGDFGFFVLRVTGGRLVTGFGGAVNVTEDTLEALCTQAQDAGRRQLPEP
jgi:heme iron utilization protein